MQSNNLAAKLERFLKDNGIEVNLINATPEVQEPGPFVPFDIPLVNDTIERIVKRARVEAKAEVEAEVEGFVDVDQDLNEEGYAIVNAP